MGSEFQVVKYESQRKYLRVESNRLEDCVAFFNDHEDELFGITVNSFHDYKLDNLEFLWKIRNVRGFALVDELNDVGALESLVHVEYLQLPKLKQRLDFSKYPSLIHFRGHWSSVSNLTAARDISKLAIWGYKPKSGDMSELSVLPSLTSLELVTCSLSNLNGLSKANKIQHLLLHYLKNLSDISELRSFTSPLMELHFENCPKIDDYSPIGSCELIERLIFERSASVKGFEFLRPLSKLKFLSFVGTKFDDDPLAELQSDALEKVVDTKGNLLFGTPS